MFSLPKAGAGPGGSQTIPPGRPPPSENKRDAPKAILRIFPVPEGWRVFLPGEARSEADSKNRAKGKIKRNGERGVSELRGGLGDRIPRAWGQGAQEPP